MTLLFFRLTYLQIAKLNSSPTSQRRKVWTLECITSYYPTPSDMTDSSTTTSRSHSPGRHPLSDWQIY